MKTIMINLFAPRLVKIKDLKMETNYRPGHTLTPFSTIFGNRLLP